MGELIHKIRTGHPWWTYGFALMIAVFIVMAYVARNDDPMGPVVILFVAASLLLAFPDMQTYFGTEGILMTFGIAGIWKVRVKREDVTRVSVTKFNGLTEFGGWGIRGGWGKFFRTTMWGMPVMGSRGIWVETSSGRKYLIPDSDPDTTIEAMRRYYPVEMEVDGG